MADTPLGTLRGAFLSPFLPALRVLFCLPGRVFEPFLPACVPACVLFCARGRCLRAFLPACLRAFYVARMPFVCPACVLFCAPARFFALSPPCAVQISEPFYSFFSKTFATLRTLQISHEKTKTFLRVCKAWFVIVKTTKTHKKNRKKSFFCFFTALLRPATLPPLPRYRPCLREWVFRGRAFSAHYATFYALTRLPPKRSIFFCNFLKGQRCTPRHRPVIRSRARLARSVSCFALLFFWLQIVVHCAVVPFTPLRKRRWRLLSFRSLHNVASANAHVCAVCIAIVSLGRFFVQVTAELRTLFFLSTKGKIFSQKKQIKRSFEKWEK